MPVAAATTTLCFSVAADDVMANAETSTTPLPISRSVSTTAAFSSVAVVDNNSVGKSSDTPNLTTDMPADGDMLTASLLAAAVAAVSSEAKRSCQIEAMTAATTKALAATSPIATDTIPTQQHTAITTAATCGSNDGAIATSATALPTAESATATPAQLLMNGFGAAANSKSNKYNCQQQHMLSDDSRALQQLALELSMVGLQDVAGTTATVASVPTTTTMQYLQNLQQLHNQQQQQHQQQLLQQQHVTQSQRQQQQQLDLNTLSAISAAVAAAAANRQQQQHTNSHACRRSSSPTASSTANTTTATNSLMHDNHHSHSFGIATASTSGLLPPTLEDRSKKSQNMTECVPVPSSEHVAEIVGRQGCKIKALRAKTNTYIKTPVRGEEPVFVVTGRKEDVAKAKREILSAAEHFSLIRATRKPSYDGSNLSVMNSVGNGSGNHGTAGSGVAGTGVVGAGGKSPPGPPCIPGQVTIQVRVPYRVVGLVVGPKGATIKHIQQETQTYIVTPSREKEPIFEVTGLPDNVQAARKQIEAHIALRTGNLPSASSAAGSASAAGIGTGSAMGNTPACVMDPTLHTINTLSQILNDDINPDFLASLYKNGICSAFDYVDNGSNNSAATAATANNNNVALCANMTSQMLISNNHAYENDYLHAIMSSSNSPLDISLQHQRLNVQRQQQQIQQQNMCHISGNNGLSLSTTSIGNFKTMTTSSVAREAVINNNGLTRSCSSASSTTSSKSTPHSSNSVGCVVNGVAVGGGGDVNSSNSSSSSSNSSTASSRPELMNIWKHLGNSIDIDEGIGESPNIWTTSLAATGTALPAPTVAPLNGIHSSPITSNSPTDSLLGEININLSTSNTQQHNFATAIGISSMDSMSCSNNLLQLQHQHQQQQNHNFFNNLLCSSSTGLRRECMICNDKEVAAALVPCGHNMFCMECANRICASGGATCPVCSVSVYHAMRILA